MSIRVHELAKELGITSKDLISKLTDLGISVKGHMSSLDEEVCILVKKSGEKPKDKKKKETKKEEIK
ncbi:translation initiation factor IF-2 N-terminal domain-containing protein, partial [bacterium]|nr:translation initiation factor IF-2 N-terminal domain-containing protein [bacterium]